MAKDVKNYGPATRSVGFVICLLAFAFIAWSFYPGLMTADSVANLTQGRQQLYTDFNSPLMSWFWGRLDEIIPGPALIFVIHIGIFWTACALFWKSTNAKSFRLGIALVVFGLAPHVLAQTVVVWKDVALGVSLLMTIALLYLARANSSRVALLLSPLFLFYGYAVRLNAFPAVLPIAIWTGFIAFDVLAAGEKRGKALLLGIGYFALLSLAVFVVNYRLTGGASDHPFQQVYLYDLAAISVETNKPRFPDHIRRSENFSMELVKSRYNERSVADLIFANVPNPGDVPPLSLTKDPVEVGALREEWRNAVTENPLVYLRHRISVFAQLIGLSRSVTAPYVADGFAGNPTEFRGGENFGYAALMKYFGAFRRPVPQTLFHRAIVWMAASVVLIFMAVRRKLRSDWDLVFVLSASSLLYVFAYFPTTPSTEFRYLFWPAIASAVAVIFGVYLWGSEVRIQKGAHQ